MSIAQDIVFPTHSIGEKDSRKRLCEYIFETENRFTSAWTARSCIKPYLWNNKIDLSLFVENLDSVSQQYAFKPHQIYSCDKTGSTCVHKPHVCKVCTIWVHEGCVYNNLCFLCEGYFENDLCVRKSHKNLLKTSKILLDFLT